MGLLYNLRNELGDTTGTPLELWVKRHGHHSIQKLKYLTAENGFTGPVPYKLESEKEMSKVLIDKMHRLSMVDKLSQVKTFDLPQRAHDVIMSYQRRCDVMTSHRRRSDFILTSCVRWVTFIFILFFFGYRRVKAL